MCRDEALELSKLQPRLANLNVPLLAMLHEAKAEEVKEFSELWAVSVMLGEFLKKRMIIY